MYTQIYILVKAAFLLAGNKRNIVCGTDILCQVGILMKLTKNL